MILFMCGVAAAAAAIYTGSMRWIKTDEVIIRSPKIKYPVRILHLSDVHGYSSQKLCPDIYKKIDGLNFDFIVITGDMVQNRASEFIPHRKYIKKLASEYRLFYVDGNHEKRIYNEFKKTLEKLGVTVLCNGTEDLIINGNRLSITGVRDFYWLRKNDYDLKTLLPVAPDNTFSVLLSHQPQIIDHLDYAPDLTLCGHTHAGQVRLPFIPALYAPGQGLLPKYDHGLYKNGKGFMYISSGIGATGFHIRFFNRPELAVIRLEPII